LQLRKHDEAISDCDHALKLEPHNAKGFYLRAVALSRLKRYPAALIDIEKAIDIDRKFAEAYNIRGHILSAGMHQYHRALSDLNMSLEMRPDNIDAYMNRAFALTEVGQIDDAIQDYFQVVQRAPHLDKPYFNRGMLYYKRSQWDRAGLDFSHYIQIHPRHARAYYLRGVCNMRLGYQRDARADFEEAIRLDPKLGESYLYRAVLYAEQNHRAEALEDLKTAEKLATGNQELLTEIARERANIEGK
jgi:tetratricopeptide (TPR) repeat protein